MHLIGYIEFAVLINIDGPHYQNIVERIHRELQEYLFIIPDSYQRKLFLQYSFVQTFLQSIQY